MITRVFEGSCFATNTINMYILKLYKYLKKTAFNFAGLIKIQAQAST